MVGKRKAEVFPLALSDRPSLPYSLWGIRPFGFSASKLGQLLLPAYANRTFSTLDNILVGRFSNKKLFIKMDVEGAEYSVLKGAVRTLRQLLKPIWLLEISLQEFHPEGKNSDYLEVFQLF